MLLRNLLILATAGAAVAACKSTTDAGPQPAHVLVTPDTVTIAQLSSASLTVQVTDKNDELLTGVAVTFTSSNSQMVVRGNPVGRTRAATRRDQHREQDEPSGRRRGVPGLVLGTILEPTDRAPMWAVLGPPEPRSAGDLYGAMKAFYARLLTDLDLAAALREMNMNRSPDDWDYHLTSAELLFCQAWRHYTRTVASEETLEQRLNRLVAGVARRDGLDVLQTMQLRDRFRAHLNDHEFWFNQYRTRFLMLDLFPENTPRFTLSFEDCAASDIRRAPG